MTFNLSVDRFSDVSYRLVDYIAFIHGGEMQLSVLSLVEVTILLLW